MRQHRVQFSCVTSVTYLVLQPRATSGFISLFCHRYSNALEAASANFATHINRKMLRGDDDLKPLNTNKRHSNSGYLLLTFSAVKISS